jgi:hypothetical protein
MGTVNWAALTVEERDRLVRTCRAGRDPVAAALGLDDPDWDDLDDLGPGAVEDLRQIVADFGALIADGGERLTVRDTLAGA